MERGRLKAELATYLIQNTPMELPQSVVDHEMRRMVRDIVRRSERPLEVDVVCIVVARAVYSVDDKAGQDLHREHQPVEQFANNGVPGSLPLARRDPHRRLDSGLPGKPQGHQRRTIFRNEIRRFFVNHQRRNPALRARRDRVVCHR
jgi:hypothetical protein